MWQEALPQIRTTVLQALNQAPINENFRRLLQDVTTRSISEKNLSLRLPLLCCLAAGGQLQHGAIVASAGLLMSTAARVIDDVQDGDSERALWREIGTAQAYNVGIALAFAGQLVARQLTEAGIPDSTATDIRDDYVFTVLNMCGGQYSDLAAEAEDEISFEAYEHMVAAKAGASTAWSCRAGAMLGTPDTPIEAYTTFGYHLGLLHQYVNDFQGLQGLDGKLDLVRRKKTLPLVYALSVAPPQTKYELQATCRTLSSAPESQARIQQLIVQLGAPYYLLLAAREHHRQAMAALHNTQGHPKTLTELSRILEDLYTAAGPGKGATRQ
jgi:geranylgeranyl pyrophosphate synthase